MNISKEHFTKLAKEHLIPFQSYNRDENGNYILQIGGVENLYDAIVANTQNSLSRKVLDEIEKEKNRINCMNKIDGKRPDKISDEEFRDMLKEI